MRCALASSADTPLAVKCGKASLGMLEIVPGVTLGQLVQRGHEDDGHIQIGRSHPLSSNKTTHFNLITAATNVPFSEMLFFDDCGWCVPASRVVAAALVALRDTAVAKLELQSGPRAVQAAPTVRRPAACDLCCSNTCDLSGRAHCRSDNCAVVEQGCPGVVCQKTPAGLTVADWEQGLEKYASAH
jgi:magnesium-dependent phosphatase 1